MYREKVISAEEAAKLVKPGDWIDLGMFNCKSVVFEKALAARKDELSDIVVFTAVTVPPIPEMLMKDPTGDVFTYIDYHFSPVTRIVQERRPNTFYQPTQFGESEGWFEIKYTDPRKIGTQWRDVTVLRTTPMDEYGYFNFAIGNGISWVQLQTSKIKIVETCDNIPYGYGGSRERVHISQIDYVIEGGDTPLFYSGAVEPTEIDRQIAGHVLELLRDGDCIQLGIGGMPNALGKMINDTDLKDLGGHTEMLGESYRDLMESGKMNNARKWFDRGKTVYTFAMGSKDLYDWIDHNPALASYHVEYVNNPVMVSRVPNMVSINQALEADLYCQVSAESSGFKQISGNGGMLDFVQGSFYSDGGRSIICLPSTFTDKNGKLHSRIVPGFKEGTIVTIPRQCVNFLVTEYGWASLKGDSTWLKAEKLINLAHPDFRDDLIKAAEERKIWRRSNKIS